jgi:hypothetical protein
MKFLEWLLTIVTMVVCGFIFAIALLDWMGGCGEVYHTAKGTVQGECTGRIFIKQIKEEYL